MSNKIKYINIKSRTSKIFNDIIDIISFDPSNIKTGEKSCKNILIYYIGYVTIKEYVKMYSANLLYLIFRYVSGCFEEINRNKYSTLVPTNEIIKKYEELWIKIKTLMIMIMVKNI